jgi:hypothetical protein
MILGALIAIFLVAHQIFTTITGRRLNAAIDRVEKAWGPLNLRSLYPPDVEPARNRTKVLRAAAEVLVLEGDDLKTVSDVASLKNIEPDRDDLVIVADAVERNALALELLAAAAERPESNWNIPYRKGVAADVPPLLPLLNIARLNGARGLMAVRDGRTEDATRAAEQGFALSESLAREPVLIVQLIRVSIDWLNLAVARAILEEGHPDAEMLARLRGHVVRIGETDTIRVALIGETNAMYSELRKVEQGNADMDRNAPLILRNAFIPWLLRPAFRSDLTFYLELMHDVVVYHERPAHRRESELGSGPFDREPRFYQVLSRTSLPNLRGISLRGDLERARATAAETALALARYRLDHGAYPESLEELVPEYLDEMPVDPFTGVPPEYRREGDVFVVSCRIGDLEIPKPLDRDQILTWKLPR